MARFTTRTFLAAMMLLGLSISLAHADVLNGGFELGGALSTPDNATSWDWTPDSNGERVNSLTNSNVDNGSGTFGNHLIDPLAGDWFGYAENSSASGSANISQSVLVDAQNPVLTFWWQFFTNESPNVENTFNDRFQVNVEGSGSLLQTVASVNGTAMTTALGPLWSPTGPPGLNQSFAHYTSGWAFYSLDVSSMAGENVTVYFRINDVGGPHSQSSGFALDKVEFITPEPSSFVLLGMGVLFCAILRRRRKAA